MHARKWACVRARTHTHTLLTKKTEGVEGKAGTGRGEEVGGTWQTWPE